MILLINNKAQIHTELHINNKTYIFAFYSNSGFENYLFYDLGAHFPCLNHPSLGLRNFIK